MTTHTPAPWKVIENGKHETPSVWSANEFSMRREICRIKDIPGAYKSNARLIAAAPELLEALETIVNMLNNGVIEVYAWNEGEQAVSRAEAAIAKAKGE